MITHVQYGVQQSHSGSAIIITAAVWLDPTMQLKDEYIIKYCKIIQKVLWKIFLAGSHSMSSVKCVCNNAKSLILEAKNYE